MKFIPNAIARKVAEQALSAKRNSPTILFGAGVVGMIGSTVLACRATLRLDEEVNNIERDIYIAKNVRKVSDDESVSEKEYGEDIAIAYGRGVASIAKLYAPSVLLGVASVACLAKSHHDLKERNLALTAAYAAVDGAFNRYRERVIDKYGEEADREMLYESETIDIIDEETGKIISTTRIVEAPGSKYARFYDEWSTRNWSPDPDVNLMVLRTTQNYMNDRLKARGHVFLNEVYDQLGLSHTKAGSVVGWRWDKNSGDDYIDFGIWDGNNEVVNDFFHGREASILLDFNVDGVIYDKLEESGV